MKMDKCMVLALFCVLPGCKLAKNNVLFATKTSWGVDVDSKPPVVDIGFSRREGSFAPVANNGEILPLLASVTGRSGVLARTLGFGVAQSFAVGNAALVLAQYFGTSTDPRDDWTADEDFWSQPASIDGSFDDARVYYFGTDTSLGLKLSVDALSSYVPEGINLGYKRKEIAFVPIHEVGEEGAEKLVVPSMIATTAGTASVDGGATVEVNQFYATGAAATLLAANPAIRQTVGVKVLGSDAVEQKIEEQRRSTMSRAELLESARQRVDSLGDGQLDDARQALFDARSDARSVPTLEDAGWNAASPSARRTALKDQLYATREAHEAELREFLRTAPRPE